MKRFLSFIMLIVSLVFCSSCDFFVEEKQSNTEYMKEKLSEILEPYDLQAIEDDLSLLPVYRGIEITWSSNKPQLSNTGKVSRDTTDTNVLLTVVMTYNGETYTKSIFIVIKGTGSPIDNPDYGSDDGGNTELPDDGGNTELPDDGGNTELPDDGGNTELPDNGGNTELPDDNQDASVVSPYIRKLFGENVKVYSNGDSNPYNIDIDSYGDNVDVIFYTPNYSVINDKYNYVTTSTAKAEFYQNYQESESVEDAYFRTKHNLMSGDISEQGHIPNSLEVKSNNKYVKVTDATYVLDTDGNYLAYIPNVVNTDNHIIFYEGAYTSLNDVAAYLLAFGKVPANSNYDKSSGKSNSISDWGKYGRVNLDKFSGNTTSYPFEPLLPGVISGSYSPYYETDFGTIGGYVNENTVTGTYYRQSIYNNGSSISRGAARFVYYGASYSKNINDRYVFYTYNHYNDFQEYLNYDNGFGMRFGNESAGNQYCGNKSDFNNSNEYPVTKYPAIMAMSLEELLGIYS